MNLTKWMALTSVALFALGLAACDGVNKYEVEVIELENTNSSSSGSDEPGDKPDVPDGSLLLDDFEDGDHGNQVGDWWFVYTDGITEIASDNPGSEGEPFPSATDNGSNYALTIKYGEVSSYAGWGTNVTPVADKIAGYNAVQYKYKGADHCLRVEISDVADYDHYKYCQGKSAEWKTVTVKFKDLAQGGWGSPVEFNPAHVEKISYQQEAGTPAGSVSIDDFYFIKVAE